MLQKRVTVGATPGKTKHFQTLNIEPDLTLADCPGLVFPSFLASRAELVCNGVMPIDQMREYANYTAPISLMLRRVGADQLREQYSLVFPNWGGEEGGEEEYRRRAEEVLNAHARMRGWMKDHGRPDESRSARVLLKDLFIGKLLYCYPPPGMVEEEKEEWKRGVERGRRSERIVGEWKGEGDDDEDDTAARIRAERGRGEGGKVNVRVMEQMLQDEYDDDLPLVEAAAAPQAPRSLHRPADYHLDNAHVGAAPAFGAPARERPAAQLRRTRVMLQRVACPNPARTRGGPAAAVWVASEGARRRPRCVEDSPWIPGVSPHHACTACCAASARRPASQRQQITPRPTSGPHGRAGIAHTPLYPRLPPYAPLYHARLSAPCPAAAHTAVAAAPHGDRHL